MKKVLLAAVSVLAVRTFGADFVKYVDPFVGTAGTGHTTPAATRPFGMVQAGPDTGNLDWGHCSGYQYGDKALYGFSQTHLSGTGCGDLGDFLVKPFVYGEVCSPVEIDKTTERASPGYYSVSAGGVKTEITVMRTAAIYRMEFPDRVEPKVLFDNQWIIQSWGEKPNAQIIEKARITIGSDKSSFSAYHRVNGWAKGRDAYVFVKFDRQWTGVEALVDSHGEKGGRRLFVFPRGTKRLEMRLALSRTSETAAEENLRQELGTKSFSDVLSDAEEEWNRLLSRVEAKACDDKMKSLYTALYHVCYSPNMISDVGERPYYSNFSLWDTFRAAHPLYTLLVPERVPGMVDSMIEDARRTECLPIWPLWGCETECMIGTHSVPVIVDAFLKGLLPEINKKEVMHFIDRSLSKRLRRTKDDWNILDRFGYYPEDLIKRESVSRTLECAYDDACAARFAKAIGDVDKERFYSKRATAWKNLFDEKEKFMRPKNADGRFVEPFNPFKQGYDTAYTEGNAWQYTWHVLHDPDGLMEIFGGRKLFSDRLDMLFKQPEDAAAKFRVDDISGLIGQYAHGNEPSHHTVFFFSLAGRRERTDELVNEICKKFYSKNTPDGLCGNDDCGQMSAWYVFACLGMYPFDPCGGKYVHFTPIIRGTRIIQSSPPSACE